MGEGDGIEMSAGVSFAHSFGWRRGEEAAVHLEPAKHIPADVTSRGVAGKQGGRESEWVEGGCVHREGRGTG